MPKIPPTIARTTITAGLTSKPDEGVGVRVPATALLVVGLSVEVAEATAVLFGKPENIKQVGRAPAVGWAQGMDTKILSDGDALVSPSIAAVGSLLKRYAIFASRSLTV